MTESFSPAELSVLFTDIGQQLNAEHDSDKVLRLVTELATDRIAGADHAGITIGRDGRPFQTVAATDELVIRTDEIQYDLNSGPCVDAITENTTFNAADLRTDARWPEFGKRAVEQTGIVSMLSLRLYLETDTGMVAGLNMYSHSPDAFDDVSETLGVLLATHGSLAVGKASAQTKARNLLQALKNSREIGIAVGVVMAQHRVTRDQAFDLLRIVSQHTHRKVADLAMEVADTGVLPVPPAAVKPRI